MRFFDSPKSKITTFLAVPRFVLRKGKLMSLIYFHILLISIAIVFSLGFGLWEASAYSHVVRMIDLVAAIGSFAVAFGLIFYLVWFIKKKMPAMKR